MSHSPFPWSTHPQTPTAVFDACGLRVAVAVGPNAEDNAALIAAIPAMIEALEQFRQLCEAWPDCDEVVSSIDLRSIRTVLASIGKKP